MKEERNDVTIRQPQRQRVNSVHTDFSEYAHIYDMNWGAYTKTHLGVGVGVGVGVCVCVCG